MSDILSISNNDLLANLDESLDFNHPLPLGDKAIPRAAGIYVVYAAKPTANGYDDLYPIYIGSSGNMYRRLFRHQKYWAFLKTAFKGKSLICTTAQTNHPQLERIEAALIFCSKPQINKMYLTHFPFGPTKIKLGGEIRGLNVENGNKIFVRKNYDIEYWHIERASFSD